ncbi:hypothetical protein GCM10028807_28510 [Spirosoma daeguense]
MLQIIQELGNYLVIPFLLASFYKWRDLEMPFRIYILTACVMILLALVRSKVAMGHAGFYISALLGVTVYGGIFHIILKRVIDTRIIWGAAAIIWVIVGWYMIRNGVQGFQLFVIIPYDLFMITFCSIYILHCLQKPDPMNSAVFLLILYLLIEFFVNLFLDVISNFLKSYLSDSFMTLLWKGILPVYNVFRCLAINWIILSVKPKLPSLDKIPVFEK